MTSTVPSEADVVEISTPLLPLETTTPSPADTVTTPLASVAMILTPDDAPIKESVESTDTNIDDKPNEVAPSTVTAPPDTSTSSTAPSDDDAADNETDDPAVPRAPIDTLTKAPPDASSDRPAPSSDTAASTDSEDADPCSTTDLLP